MPVLGRNLTVIWSPKYLYFDRTEKNMLNLFA